MRFYNQLISLFLCLLLIALPTSMHGQNAEGGSRRIEQARPWLGVAIEMGKSGVLVKEVIAGTPAAESGMQPGDEITAISNVKVAKPTELIAAVRAQGVGSVVTVAFLRKDKSMTKDLKLVARPDDLEMLRKKVIDKPAPATVLELVSGDGADRLDGYKGKTVLVEFWATWCPACRATHERLSAFAKQGKEKGIVVLGISNEEKAEIKAYADKTKPGFVVLRDKTNELHKELLISAIPMLLVIDKTGVIRFATIGGGSYLEEAIEKAEKLAKGP